MGHLWPFFSFPDWPGRTLVWPVRVLSSLKIRYMFLFDFVLSLNWKKKWNEMKINQDYWRSSHSTFCLFRIMLHVVSLHPWINSHFQDHSVDQRNWWKLENHTQHLDILLEFLLWRNQNWLHNCWLSVKYNPRSLIISSPFSVPHQPWRVYYFRCGSWFFEKLRGCWKWQRFFVWSHEFWEI